MDSIGIGALAKRAGVRIDTVQLRAQRAARTEDSPRLDYRRYGSVELDRLRFIRRAQALGFTLKEVRELLALSSRHDVAKVWRTAQDKLSDVERRIAALGRVRNGLAALIAVCPGHRRAADCPILTALGGEESP